MRHGLLLIDKGRGCTSHDVVRQVRRALRQKKVGHCGTLDPDATGLLVLTLGQGTRLTRFLIQAPKVYEGVLCLGTATDTYDASGTVVRAADTSGLSQESIVSAMKRFEGEIEQTPPPYCAKKVGGVKYYELARRGEEVPREKKSVRIFGFEPLSRFDGAELRFRLSCSSGTYARSLAHELGESLGSAAHLSELRRLQVGSFKLEDAITAEETEGLFAAEDASPAFVPFDDIPLPFSEVRTDLQQERRITHGQPVLVKDASIEEGDWVKVVNNRQHLVAVGTVIERVGRTGVGVVQPKIVFHH